MFKIFNDGLVLSSSGTVSCFFENKGHKIMRFVLSFKD